MKWYTYPDVWTTVKSIAKEDTEVPTGYLDKEPKDAKEEKDASE